MGEMTADAAWVALRRTPWRLLATSWPWRSILYLTTGIYLLPALLLSWLARSLPFGSPRRRIARIERRRLRLMRIPSASVRAVARVAARTVPGRQISVLVALCLIAPPVNLLLLSALGGAVGITLLPLMTAVSGITYPWQSLLAPAAGAIVIGVAAVFASLYAITGFAALQARAARSMVAWDDSRSRGFPGELLESLDAERKRIEHDLHDCTQQRLVTLSLTLAQAELMLPDSDPAAALVARARQGTDQALAELRGLIRGIHPQLLVDRGLAAAIADLTERQAFPVSAEIAVPDRLPPHVERTAYFLVSEALTNIGKHSGADAVTVEVTVARDRLAIRVVDNGVGGARLDEGGTGMRGMAWRLQALGGMLSVSSPPGGPTELRAHLPTDPG
jgi:signal transduction histidine kinase